jgi:DNA-binding response OmpR family regulator
MKAKVLLVDNYPGIRESLGHASRMADYDVTLASSEEEPLNALRDTGFDIVLLDVVMPALNAWDAFLHIVAMRFSSPMIIIIGRSDRQ